MNKSFNILILLMLLNLSKLFGQGVAVGITGGLNMSSINMQNTKYQPGYQVGGFAELMISKRFGIQTEALYSMHRSLLGNESIELNYLSVPVLLKFNINQFINFQIGPQYSMLINSNTAVDMLEEQISNRDIYLTIGLGVDMPMGFGASLRFLNGLKEVHDGVGVTSDMVQLSISISLLQFEK